MISKAATDTQNIKIGMDAIGITVVKGDDSLKRVTINSEFAGYIQKRNEELHRLNGHKIHDLIFARLCAIMR